MKSGGLKRNDGEKGDELQSDGQRSSPMSPIALSVRSRGPDQAKGKHRPPAGTGAVHNNGVGKRLLNAEEPAQYLGLATETVYKMARLRQLPSIKIGRALRFDVEALARLIRERTIEAID